MCIEGTVDRGHDHEAWHAESEECIAALIAEVDRLRVSEKFSHESWTNTSRHVEELFGADWDVARHDVLASGNQGWAMIVGVAVGALHDLIANQVDEINGLRADNARMRAALEQYADKTYWGFNPHSRLGLHVLWLIDNEEGPELAREALAGAR